VTDASRPVKVSAQSVLGAPRRPITRYRPWVIGMAILGLLLLIGLGFLLAFGGGQARRAPDPKPTEPEPAPVAPTLDRRLPASYDDPLAQRPAADDAGAITSVTAPVPVEPASHSPLAPEVSRVVEEARAARASGPFFGGQATGAVVSATPVAMPVQDPGVAAAALAGRSAKEQFVAGSATTQDYVPHLPVGPLSPFEIKAGAIIPAALITGLNSDLPGPVIAQVTEPIYDHATGSLVLIPQGARLIGRYDSQIGYGQDRVLVVWNRIIFPDGRSLNIGAMTGSDTTGAGGLKDRVDAHVPVLARAIGLSTLISIGGTAAQNGVSRGSGNLVLQDGVGGVSAAASQVGQRLVDRDLQRAPTLRVRPGWPLRIVVDRDLVVTP
jgi:type IV secretory pathway VirB10-like protein